MSKKIVAPASHFYSIPETISLEAAALIEPLAVAWHAVNLTPFNPGDNVLLVGGGPIGLGVVQVLKLQGARNIMVSELMESRQQLCRTYGATHILDPREGDVAQGVREITSGVGADVIFDAAGVEKALIGTIPACKAQGTIVNIAVWEKSPSIPVNHLMYKELRYMGAALYDETSFLDTIRAVNDGKCTFLTFFILFDVPG
jgi:threonine dehydrogenase-like Zn-dependent dehydrogenase